jgi:hypothetical protein
VVAAAHMQSEAEEHCFPRDPTHDVRTVKMHEIQIDDEIQ